MIFDISKLKRQLIKYEGLKLKPYQDTVGKWTIGVGRNLDDLGISESEAHVLLTNDINRIALELAQKPYVLALNGDDVRTRVIVEMAFNLGVPRLEGFKDMLEAIMNRAFIRAGDEMLNSKWSGQVGQRAVKLADMMRTGRDE